MCAGVYNKQVYVLRGEGMSRLEFIADKVRINGPKVDGGYSVTFEVGDYEQDKVASLLTIPQGEAIQISVEVGNG